MSDVIKALKWRYATKKFDASRNLSAEKIEVLKEAFALTATSYGLQPVQLVIISNPTLKAQLPERSMNQQQVKDASHVLVFCIEKEIDQAYITQYFERIKAIRQTPDDILQPFKNSLQQHFNTTTATEIQHWATQQAYLAMGNLLTVCALENIDACPMEGFDPKAYDELLNLEEKGLQSVLIMPVGYRATDDRFASFKKVRKPIEASISEI